LLGAVLPVDGLLQLAQQLMAACYFALQWLATTPNAVWQSHAPAPWTVLLALAGCAWLLLPRGVGARSFGVAMLLPMLLLLPPRPLPGELWLTLLDVGQGLAVVVCTSDHALVYDSGPSFNPDSDAGSRIVVPYLRGEGIRALDALVITHDDDDHSGGAHSIIAARDPQWILTSLDPARTILTGAREVLRCDDRDRWQWDGVDFAVLHPHPDNYAEARRKTNDLGCVLRIRAPGGSILLTADIERRSEAELLARIAADSDTLNADVLLVPHHGSKTSSSDALLDAVRPRLALVAVGYRNRFHHPNGVVMARYAARGIEVLRSDQSGAITLKFAADAAGVPSISGYRQTQRRYWLDAPTAVENTD
jgi:competence protein ComEC